MLPFLKRRRRSRLRATPVPTEWRALLAREVPYWTRLSDADRDELLGHVQVLLAEKHWEGCGGFPLEERHCVLVAAQAALLLLHRETDYFPQLTSILVYPDEYVIEEARHIGDGPIMVEGEEIYAGHTQERLGALVLSWADVEKGVRDPYDGYNVVLHEFAHQLDFEDGGADGAPAHERGGAAARWAAVMRAEYDRLRREVRRGRDTLLDPYGAEDPVEFFAVATETFFELPLDLRDEHPALYEELSRYYRQDPATDEERVLPQ